MSELKIYIDGQLVETAKDETGVPVSYKLEENEDFQNKSSSSALSITIPATKHNSQISNSFHNPGIQDLTSGEAFRNARNALIMYGSWELLKGKAFLKQAQYTSNPLNYTYDFHGDNADWITALATTTLFDVLQNLTFDFTVSEIMESWKFDGTNEARPYVFAPVRYGQPMDDAPTNYVQANPDILQDYSMAPEYMKPSISPYWLIQWGFRLIGYRVNSVFMENPYFKRLVMPWTWGNFLFSEGTQTQNLTFLAKSTGSITIDHDFTGIMDLLVSNDTTNGAFDDNDVYKYDAVNKVMQWTYSPAFDYGTLEATFHLAINYSYVATDSGDVEARVQWFKNGQRITTGKPGENSNGDKIFMYNAPTVGGNRDDQLIDIRQSITVNSTDIVTAKFYGHLNDTGVGTSRMTLEVITFEPEYFRVPIGGTIKFTNYLSLKNYLFLDLLRGLVDCFNLIPKANSITKEITMEPQHPYALSRYSWDLLPGYFNNNLVDWNRKQDISKPSTIILFDDYNRNVVFKFKDDTSDGILKKIQDRYTTTLAQAKYVLPDRFGNDTTLTENRFFSPVMHYNVMQWKSLGVLNDAPQMVCMIPENVSNTSSDEAQNTFSPKLCYYKGQMEGYGWVFNQIKQTTYPFMFAVNYKQGGDTDPVLSYGDEKLLTGPLYLTDDSGNFVLDDADNKVIVDPGGYYIAGAGFLRRFYLQRMAIMRNGQYLTTNFLLKNIDVANVLHREYIMCQGEKWELVEINNYNPVKQASTECSLRKWSPITQQDNSNIFPASDSVLGNPTTNPLDMKYAPLLALSTDIS